MTRIQVNADGLVTTTSEGLLIRSGAGAPCCCGPGEPRGWTSLLRCDNGCDSSFPTVLFIEEGRCSTAAVYFWMQSVCYRCTGERLWDCANHGPAPSGYTCAPFAFYLPGTRVLDISQLGTRASCSVDDCAMCVPANHVVLLPPCFACRAGTGTDCNGDPFPDPPDGIDRNPYVRYSDIINALANVPGILNRRCVAVRVGVCCFKVDLIEHPVIPGELPDTAHVWGIDAIYEACCDCAAAIGERCLTAFELQGSPSVTGQLSCVGGARRDEFKRYLCPSEVPSGLKCCCPGLISGEVLQPGDDPRDFLVHHITGRRVEVQNDVVTTTTVTGTIPGIIEVSIDGVVRDTIPFTQLGPCDPWFGLTQLLGVLSCPPAPGEQFDVQASGDCRNARYHATFARTGYTNTQDYECRLGPRETDPPFWGESAWFACNDGCGGGNPLYWPPGDSSAPPPPGGLAAGSGGCSDCGGTGAPVEQL